MSKMVDVRVPDIGDFHDVPVVEVRVSPGAAIKRDDPVVVLESDKASMDVPSPETGIVRTVQVKLGDKVSAGTPLFALEIADETGVASPGPSGPAAARPEQAGPGRSETESPDGVISSPPPAGQRRPLPLASGVIPDESGRLRGELRPSPTAGIPLVLDEAKAQHHAAPAVRRLARELGVDLAQLQGTGRNGRIVEEDLRRHIKEALARTPAAGAGKLGLPELPAVDFSRFGPVEAKPLGRIRRATAAQVRRSWLLVPHVTQYDEADITDLEAFRKSEAEQAKQRGVRLTLLSFVMKAAVAALKEYPTFNASLDATGENLVWKRYFHIGVAVDTPEGLVVPVVRDVDRKGIWELASALSTLSQRAREQKLTPADMEGASFTISSLGGIGGTAFSPIVNAPEVAILGVSRASLRPVYRDGQLVPRLILPFSLSYDHRANDGAQAARFTSHLSQLLSDIREVLL